ncbi:msl5920 [Mesorhizobium japonicum MAFF 303099]|uniref:Msl5920 protein n=1 Tax=Mesorhizobium japonicum (strain LMG 29417 / CECT 9101 / MAFF 303099) TaxID=266835 RepID=Q98AN4_RHILO|nr:msl5920 [Mesorhizobium japonicum MAFF 303099]
MCILPFQGRRHFRPGAVSRHQSVPIVWIGKFTHPAKQKTSRSIHAIDDFAKNWAFKEIAIFVA